MEQFVAIALTVITAATPLLIAAIGELVVERSGVLNLGVEGMMVMGAVCGFGAAFITGNPYVGVIAAIAAGAAMAFLFGVLTLIFVSNQVATGLALTLLGLGLSGLIGESFVGEPGVRLPKVFWVDILVFASFILTAAVAWVLFRTKTGLVIRAVGDSHGSAHALGYRVIAVRFACVLFGGACAGLAGGYLSLAYTPQWVENMTAGRGWIALALVVFASWRPWRVVAGAYLFGAISILAYAVQTLALGIQSQFLSSMPYIVTILALVVISGNRRLTRTNTPACLGQPFVPDR
jgi:general nucleoside transport system permease protein